MKAKIFISDLHIGDGSAADDFNLKKEIFCSLLIKLTNTYAAGSELILLGDIFDLIEQQSTLDIRNYKQNLLKALNKSLQQHKEALEALRIWLHSGNKIFYITGNHDHAMRWPNFSKPFLNTLLIAPEGLEADPNAWERIIIDDWYASETFGIYAEHGNRFDDENNHNGETICFGDRIVVNVLRPLETDASKYLTDQEWQDPFDPGYHNPFRHIDNIRPRGNIIAMVNNLSGTFLKLETKKKLKELLLDVAKKNPHNNAFKKILLKYLSILISDGLIKNNLNDHYLPYRENAWNMMYSAKHNIMHLRDLSFRPKFIVMGHTHFFDQYQIGNFCAYINLSSWLDTIYVDKSGTLKKKNKMKNCPLLVFADENPNGTPIMYNVTENKISQLDWDKLLKNREQFDIPTTIENDINQPY